MCDVASLKDTRPELVRSGSPHANEGGGPSDRKQEDPDWTPGLHASDTPVKCTAKHVVPTHVIKRNKEHNSKMMAAAGQQQSHRWSNDRTVNDQSAPVSHRVLLVEQRNTFPHLVLRASCAVLTKRPAPVVGLPTKLWVKRSADRLCEGHHIFRKKKEAAYDATAFRAAAFEVHLCGHHPTKLEKCGKTHCMVRTPNMNASPKCLLHPESGKTSSSSPKTL